MKMYVFCCEKEQNSRIIGAEDGIEVVKQYLLARRIGKVFEINQLELNEQKRVVINQLLKREKIVVFIGGDHSCTANLANIFLQINKIIVFDAHNDNEINPSELKNWNFMAYLEKVQEGLVIGYREKHILMPVKNDFHIIKDYECKDYHMVAKRISDFCKDINYLYVTIDLDVITPCEMPGVSFPVAGGIQLTELLFFLDVIMKEKIHLALDIVEFNPRIENEYSKEVIFRIVEELFEIYQKTN